MRPPPLTLRSGRRLERSAFDSSVHSEHEAAQSGYNKTSRRWRPSPRQPPRTPANGSRKTRYKYRGINTYCILWENCMEDKEQAGVGTHSDIYRDGDVLTHTHTHTHTRTHIHAPKSHKSLANLCGCHKYSMDVPHTQTFLHTALVHAPCDSADALNWPYRLPPPLWIYASSPRVSLRALITIPRSP